jgi:hypothetical protein
MGVLDKKHEAAAAEFKDKSDKLMASIKRLTEQQTPSSFLIKRDLTDLTANESFKSPKAAKISFGSGNKNVTNSTSDSLSCSSTSTSSSSSN